MKEQKCEIQSAMIKELLECEELNDWEIKFVESVDNQEYLTSNQAIKLEEVYNKRVEK
jgi:hypothetical protein